MHRGRCRWRAPGCGQARAFAPAPAVPAIGKADKRQCRAVTAVCSRGHSRQRARGPDCHGMDESLRRRTRSAASVAAARTSRSAASRLAGRPARRSRRRTRRVSPPPLLPHRRRGRRRPCWRHRASPPSRVARRGHGGSTKAVRNLLGPFPVNAVEQIPSMTSDHWTLRVDRLVDDRSPSTRRLGELARFDGTATPLRRRLERQRREMEEA